MMRWPSLTTPSMVTDLKKAFENWYMVSSSALSSGLLEEDAHVLGREDHPLLEAAQHAGVQLVHPDARPRLAGEVADPAEMIDVGVGDDDVADVVDRHALPEARPHFLEALVESLDRVVGAGAVVHECQRVAVDDQVDIVDVPRERLDGHPVDADPAPAHELLHLHRLLRHAQ